MKRAVFPGSFDPFTKGHEGILAKAISLFDEVIIAVGQNSTKSAQFELSKRIEHIHSLYLGNTKVKIISFTGLTVDFCKTEKAEFIVRGLRDSKDFQYEAAIAQMNLDMSGIQTVFFLTDAKFSAISSTIIREIYRNGGEISKFVTNPSLLV